MTGKRWPPRDERGRFSRPAKPEVELPEGVPAALELPSALPERVADGVHTVWVRTLHELAARELLDVTDPNALLRYCRAQARFELLEREWEEEGCPTTSTRGTGGTMAHPMLAMIERAETSAARYAADLQLTTAARLRTGYDKPGQSRLPGMPGAVESAAPPKLKVVGQQ